MYSRQNMCTVMDEFILACDSSRTILLTFTRIMDLHESVSSLKV